MMQELDQQFKNSFNEVQNIIMTIRRVQLAVGSFILFFIIFSIIRKKLYVYNTTKLFMWCCIFYFIGMFIVCLHTSYMSGDYQFSYQETKYAQKQNYILKILTKMKLQGSLYWCGLEAFINLYAYDFGYFFAVLVSYNVFCVINGNYRNFMKNVFTNIKVLAFLLFMLVVYFIPYVLVLTTDDFQNQFTYSYAPMGFQYRLNIEGKQRIANLLLFSGFDYRPDQTKWRVLSLVNIYLCPFLMLIIHTILLILNNKKINKFHQEDYLNSKQLFLIKSGTLGTIVFVIQALHFFKLFLGLISYYISWWFYLIIGLNFMFDLYPGFLLYFYFKYTKQKSGSLIQSSTILQKQQQNEEED